MSASKIHPPKDGLVRFGPSGLELRAAAESGMPTLFGYFIRFNEWTLIDSLFEGKFYERIAPGAAKKALEESRDQIRILFNHGCDPTIGEKPLTAPELVEDTKGVRYEGELFDTEYCRELVPALRSGQLGASFKFRAVKESFDEEPGRSTQNPEGLPQRTIEEIKLYEGGPVTFPAYAGASAGVRSATDQVFIETWKRHPEAHAEEMEGLVRTWIEREPVKARAFVEAVEDRKAIAYRKTETTDTAWDGPAVKASIPNDAGASVLRRFFAWEDPEADPDTKSAYKFVHHQNDDGRAGAANLVACSTGIGVLNGAQKGTTIPETDRQGVYDHLAHHLRDGGREPAPLRSIDDLHAEERDALIEAGLAEESVDAALAEEDADFGALRLKELDPEARRDDEPSAEEAEIENDDPDDVRVEPALSGAEEPHSAGSREAPWRAPSAAQTPPWRRNAKPASPWNREKEKQS